MTEIATRVLDRIMAEGPSFVHCPYRKNEARISTKLCRVCKITECEHNPKNKEKEMTKEALTLSTVMEKLEAIEALVARLLKGAEIAGGKPGAVEAGKPNGKRKLSKAEKDIIKKELVAGGPYDKKGLENLGTKKSRMLASGMGLNTFGKAVEDVQKMILDKQKKIVKKASTGKKK